MKLSIDKYKAFFFDFDGVVTDSVNIKTEAFATLYRPFGEDVVAKVVSHHISHGGLSRFEKIRYYHKTYLNKELSESELVKLANKFSDLVIGKVLNAPFINGALEFLELLKKENKKIFIISATPESEIKKIIKKKKLDKYFMDVKGSPANKKENLKYLIMKHKLRTLECLYFGDSEQDLNAATNLYIPFIAINYFNKDKGYRDFIELMHVWNLSRSISDMEGRCNSK